jgi:hypothetical protein
MYGPPKLVTHLWSSASSLFFNVRTSFHQGATNGAAFTEESLCGGGRRRRPPTCHHDSRYVRKLYMYMHMHNKSHDAMSFDRFFFWLMNNILAFPLEMASVGAAKCRHLSGTFEGMCGAESYCVSACLAESRDNIGGECDDFPFRCYCITSCC